MDTLRICQQCRQPLPEKAPEGLCPACLAKVALGSEPAAPGATINIKPLAEAAPATRAAPDPAQLAAQFPQLEIIELLGMGGMGMVYKARQPRVDRFVALKILPVESNRGASFAERFQREARALAKLNHPGIVTFYDFGQTSEYYYFIMEYVDGMNLRHLLHNQPLEPRQALELVTQICTALQFAHDEGVVHRDIKPENILLNKKGHVKIADFGLAKLLGTTPDTALTMSQAAMGTMNYMAPEQRKNAQAVDHRADIYSLGVVFYEMLTGEVPMGRFEAPSKRVQVDVRLDEVVLKALEREPARRYQQVSEVKTNVETITATTPVVPAAPATAAVPLANAQPSYARSVFKIMTAWPMILSLLLCSALWFFVPTLSYFYGLCLLTASLATPFIQRGFKAASQGLRWCQLPPAVRRRGKRRMAAATVGCGVACIAAWSLFAGHTVEWREEWLFPKSHAYEKIGLAGHISSFHIPAWNTNSFARSGTMALKIYRKDSSLAMLTFNLPGLRVENDPRDPSQAGTPLTALTFDRLINWLHEGAGLDITQPQMQAEARQLMELFEPYRDAAPASWNQLAAVSSVVLRDFKIGGVKSGYAEFGAFIIAVPCVGLCIFYLLTLPMYKRTFAEGRAEIEAGRWTPPKLGMSNAPLRVEWVLKRSTLIWILFGFIAALICGIIGVIEGRTGTTLLILMSLGILIIVALQLHSRQKIKEVRERGLWPKLGDLPNLEQIKGLAQAGEKVLAIKLYREMYGVPLADAKAAVEKLVGQFTPIQKGQAVPAAAPPVNPVPPTPGLSSSTIRSELEAYNPPSQPGFASTMRKTSNLIVLACLLGTCAGLVPGISYTGSYWGLKLIYFQIPDSPMTVNGVERGSPAERTGFMFGDVLKSMDGATNLHASSHQTGSVVGEKHTYTVERGGKEMVLNAISTEPQLAAIWYEDITCPIAAALFICIGIVVFASAPVVPPPLWRSISVTIAGLVIAVALGIAIGAATFADRVAIYQRWPWLDVGKEWYFQQGLIGIAASVLVAILGAAEIRQRLTKPPTPTGAMK
jgi:predicted Ser/Thr protein kinase